MPCDPNRPVAIPRDPDRDLALDDRAQKVLKAILQGTGDDRRIPGRRRWCAWMGNDRLRELIDGMGQTKAQSYLDRGLRTLEQLGRIKRLSLTEFRQWLIEDAPRHGLCSDPPEAMKLRKGRVIIVLAELPPVVSEAYGPLHLAPPDEMSTFVTVTNTPRQSDERADLDVTNVNRSEIRSELSEREPILSTSGRNSDDDGRSVDLGETDPQAEPDPVRRQLLENLQACPTDRRLRYFLDKYDREKANPPTPAPCRPVAPPPPPIPVVVTLAPQNATQSRPGPETARRLAEAGRSLYGTGDTERAEQLAVELLDLVDRRHDDDMIAVVRGATLGLAAGSIAPDGFYGYVSQLGNKGMTNPAGFLRARMLELGAQKSPVTRHSAKVHVTGPQ